MKKIFALILTALVAFSLISCGNGEKDKDKAENTERLNGLFDNGSHREDTAANSGTGTDNSQTQQNPLPGKNDGSTDKAPDNDREQDSREDTGKEDDTKPDSDKEQAGENGSEESGNVERGSAEGNTDPDKEPPFDHTLYEKSVIVSRYREAEDFYYDMLLQNFELDNMDTVKITENGYETVFRRVILEDINSLDELKALYRLYFTAGFVGRCDFSAYREANGKLYCCATASTVADALEDGKCTVNDYDGKGATITVSFSSGSAQKISAVRVGEVWYFDGVAIK